LAEGTTGAREARHDGADGNIEDEGDVFVLDLFDVAEEESFAEWRLKLFERRVESGLVVESDARQVKRALWVARSAAGG
jgi:hypothetical protein